MRDFKALLRAIRHPVRSTLFVLWAALTNPRVLTGAPAEELHEFFWNFTSMAERRRARGTSGARELKLLDEICDAIAAEVARRKPEGR